jgi:hypothetical protein
MPVPEVHGLFGGEEERGVQKYELEEVKPEKQERKAG